MPRITRLALFAAAALAAAAVCAVPKPGYYHPSSVQVGTTTRVIMGGDAVGDVRGAWVTGEGVTVKRIVPVPGFPRASGRTERPWMINWLYDLLDGKLPKDKRHRELPPEALSRRRTGRSAPGGSTSTNSTTSNCRSSRATTTRPNAIRRTRPRSITCSSST